MWVVGCNEGISGEKWARFWGLRLSGSNGHLEVICHNGFLHHEKTVWEINVNYGRDNTSKVPCHLKKGKKESYIHSTLTIFFHTSMPLNNGLLCCTKYWFFSHLASVFYKGVSSTFGKRISYQFTPSCVNSFCNRRQWNSTWSVIF